MEVHVIIQVHFVKMEMNYMLEEALEAITNIVV